MSLFMLDYCKAVDRQIWPHLHPLRQFDKDISLEVCPIDLFPTICTNHYFTALYSYVSRLVQILRKLEERGADLDRLQEMQEKDIGALIRYANGGKVLSIYGQML